MLEHFRADGDIVLAKLQRPRRILEMGGDLGKRPHIVEEGGIDVDCRHLSFGSGKSFRENSAADPDLEQPVAGLAVLNRVTEHPIAARTMELAAGGVRIGV
jgi:hypothetical protein